MALVLDTVGRECTFPAAVRALDGWQQSAPRLDPKFEEVQQLFAACFECDSMILRFIKDAYVAGVKVLQFWLWRLSDPQKVLTA